MAYLSDTCSKLWELDQNCLKEGRDYGLDLEGDVLFSFVDEARLKNVPTIVAFRRLLDKYDAEDDQVPAHESDEAWEFLNSCLQTEVMKEAHLYLSKEGLMPVSKEGFKHKLYDLWFGPYYRPYLERSSTSFEHTFVGEPCHESSYIFGLHNWIRLYQEEQRGWLTYEGWEGSTCAGRVICINIDWDGYQKWQNSFFIGTSPEFELAIYTICYLAGEEEETRVSLGNNRVTIVTYDWDGVIGACYPKGEDPLVEEGEDFLDYLEEQNIGPELGKWKLKEIYEGDYTVSCGRRPGTPFSQVLYTLKEDGKVDVYSNQNGVDVVYIEDS